MSQSSVKQRKGSKMKRLIEDVDGEGLIGLMGQRITLFCVNYIYTGKLVGVNEAYVMLADAGIVYETGDFQESDWRDYQSMTNPVYVMMSAVEAFVVLK